MPRSGYSRHTMGNDWGGRRKMNPEGCPKVTRQDVLDYAKSKGVEVWNDGDYGARGTWWQKDENGVSLTLGITNYIALQTLKREYPD